jgi:hypothetical protein
MINIALTAQIFPLLREASARVTTLSALAVRSGSFQWDDLQYHRRKPHGDLPVASHARRARPPGRCARRLGGVS